MLSHAWMRKKRINGLSMPFQKKKNSEYDVSVYIFYMYIYIYIYDRARIGKYKIVCMLTRGKKKKKVELSKKGRIN